MRLVRANDRFVAVSYALLVDPPWGACEGYIFTFYELNTKKTPLDPSVAMWSWTKTETIRGLQDFRRRTAFRTRDARLPLSLLWDALNTVRWT